MSTAFIIGSALICKDAPDDYLEIFPIPGSPLTTRIYSAYDLRCHVKQISRNLPMSAHHFLYTMPLPQMSCSALWVKGVFIDKDDLDLDMPLNLGLCQLKLCHNHSLHGSRWIDSVLKNVIIFYTLIVTKQVDKTKLQCWILTKKRHKLRAMSESMHSSWASDNILSLKKL